MLTIENFTVICCIYTQTPLNTNGNLPHICSQLLMCTSARWLKEWVTFWTFLLHCDISFHIIQNWITGKKTARAQVETFMHVAHLVSDITTLIFYWLSRQTTFCDITGDVKCLNVLMLSVIQIELFLWLLCFLWLVLTLCMGVKMTGLPP